MAEAMRLYGLKAVVLAGASGMGEAICRTLVKHGASVLALDTDASNVEAIYKRVRGVNGRVLDADASHIGEAVVESAKAELGGIDIVINHIELPLDSPIRDGDEQALEELLDARSKIFEAITDASLPLLKRSPAGRIINIGFERSMFAIDGEQSFERATKALADFSGNLATEHGHLGISANYLQPGAIMTRESRKVYSAEIELRDYCIKRSAARRLGETVDVAKVVLFLATGDASFVNGTGVLVDGGRAKSE